MKPTSYPIIPISDTAHLKRTADRFDDIASSGRAKARALRVESKVDVNAESRLFSHASAAPSTKKKLFWLHRAADVISTAVVNSDAAACREGCSHCCHIPVMISAPEAHLLAKRTGRRMVEQPSRSLALSYSDPTGAGDEINEIRDAAGVAFTGVPCTFLKDDNCSVYPDRPLACRYHVSLDDDDLLCQLTADTTTRAPYLDSSRRLLAATVILGPTQRIADIRDWFPAPSETAP